MKDKCNNSICFFINSDWYFKLHWIDRATACLLYGYKVYIICRFTVQSNKLEFEKKGFYCYESNILEHSLNPFKLIISTVQMLKLIKKINPNILHSITIKPIIIGGINSLLLDKIFVASFVGLGRLFANNGIIMIFVRSISIFLYKLIFKNKKSIAIFEHQNDLITLKKILGKNKNNSFIIDGAGVSLNKFNYTQEPKFQKPSILFASRLLWSKGLGTLVQIKEKLAIQGIDFELKVAGIVVADDRDAISLKKIKEWKEKGLIFWLGTVNNISKIIDDCHIIALPSIYPEGIPRILIEGAAKGRPCIAYDCGGCYKIVVNNLNGYLVTKGDDFLLEKRIKTLILNKDLRQFMGFAGRKLIEEKFSSSLVINKTLKIYKNVLKKY